MTQSKATDMSFCIKEDVKNGVVLLAGDGYLKKVDEPDCHKFKITKKLTDWIQKHFYCLKFRYRRIHPYFLSNKYLTAVLKKSRMPKHLVTKLILSNRWSSVVEERYQKKMLGKYITKIWMPSFTNLRDN